MLNSTMLKMLFGSLGIDGADVEKRVTQVAHNVQYMETEIAAQGAMIRSICKHLGLPVIAQATQTREIEHGNG